MVSGPSTPTWDNPYNDNYSPGRFYVSIATKLIIAHVLKNFDCSLLDQNRKNFFTWRSYVLPKEDVLVKFSPRVQEAV